MQFHSRYPASLVIHNAQAASNHQALMPGSNERTMDGLSDQNLSTNFGAVPMFPTMNMDIPGLSRGVAVKLLQEQGIWNGIGTSLHQQIERITSCVTLCRHRCSTWKSMKCYGMCHDLPAHRLIMIILAIRLN
jgi:hypothetical protein